MGGGEKGRVSAPSWLDKKLRDPEFRKAYEEERAKLDMSETLLAFLDDLGITQAELAKRLGVRPSTVSRMLAEGHLPRLDSLMRVLGALNARMEVSFEAKKPGAGATAHPISYKVTYGSEA